jgi:uncharacterized membrane protein SpoIIM required for sporulation
MSELVTRGLTVSGSSADEGLRSVRFRQAREADWAKLEDLTTRAERRGVRALDFDEVRALAGLYRQACTSLSVAREISLDKSLLFYLEALTARAYFLVYAPQETLSGVVSRFFRSSGPAAIRRCAPHILLSFLALGLGALIGGLLYFSDPEWLATLAPAGLGDPRRPGATTEDLLGVIYDTEPPDGGQLAAFAGYLFSNNTRVAIFAFGLGAFAGLPTVTLLLYNGLGLGALMALHIDRGIGMDLFGWLSIHGVTELAAIVIAGAGGLRLGQAVLFPGGQTRRRALREAGRDATKLAVVASVMLIVAALVEGFGRQLIQGLTPRLVIGWGLGAMWLAWFMLAGRTGSEDRKAGGGWP